MKSDEFISKFILYTKPLEGKFDHLYLDQKGLVTIGYGVLVDNGKGSGSNPSKADKDMLQKWLKERWFDGSPTLDQIQNDWKKVKSKSKKTGQYTLTDIGLQELTKDVVGNFVEGLRKAITPQKYDSLPLAAKLGLLSLAWAVGASLDTHNKLKEAIRANPIDWKRVIEECPFGGTIDNKVWRGKNWRENGFPLGWHKRIAAQIELFKYAEKLSEDSTTTDLDTLEFYWKGNDLIIDYTNK